MPSIIRDTNQNIYRINKRFSEGGQGAVFRVENNDSVIIKAKVNLDTDEIIQDESEYRKWELKVQRIASLGEFEYLAAPDSMLEKPYCGYTMRFLNGLMESEVLMYPKVILSKDKKYILDKKNKDSILAVPSNEIEMYYYYISTGGLLKRLRCLARLAKILYKFEDRNIVYCDISPKNVFVSSGPSDYETWLIDIDNLTYATGCKKPIGTPSFMAPEVVMGNPNTIYSDRFSFALVAYRMLLLKDPFVGKLADNYSADDADEWDSDEPDFDAACGQGKIPWIYEINDDSNRFERFNFNPHKFLNEELFNLFERTFNSEGRSNPKSRPSMHEWYDALVRAVESCSNTNIFLKSDKFSKLNKYNDPVGLKLTTDFLGEFEPYFGNDSVNRIKVTIKDVTEFEDLLICVNEKSIFFELSTNKYKYYLSNYDILPKTPNTYVDDFITINKEIVLHKANGGYSVECKDYKYSVDIIENGAYVFSFSDFLSTVLLIKENGKYIKKITFEKGTVR